MKYLAALLVATGSGSAIADGITDFESGTGGWSISGRDTIDAAGGNGGANMHGELIDVFGADIRNNTNADVLGDLTRYGQFELTVDVKVNSISSPFFPGELPRELVVELRDTDNDNGLPWTSVWFSLGVLNAAENNDWVTYSVVVDDPFADGLPLGWGGYGDEDPNTFEPILPADRTFTSVIQSVDEMAFTTFVPGFFFGFTDFDIQIDNVGIRTVPAPSMLALIGAAGLVGTRRRR